VSSKGEIRGLTQPHVTAESSGSLLVVWWATIVLLLVQRPLTAPDLWWHLARGRAAFSGNLTPSRDLLILDSAREADWLGGVPFYFAHSVAGNAALAATPLLAATALLLLARRQVRREEDAWKLATPPMALVALPLLLWVVREGLQPVPALFDLAGIVALWSVLQASWRPRVRLVAVVLTFAVWASLGPRPVWGLLVLVALCPRERFEPRLLAAALLGGCLTPRGLWTWIDAAVLFAPAAWSRGGGPAEWSGLFSPLRFDWATSAFVLLWSMWVVCGWPLRSQNLRLVRWSIPLLAAMLSRSNLPACGIWILLDVWQFPGQLSRSQFLAAKQWQIGLGLSVGVLVLIDASGRGLPPYDRLGGGIAHQLDHRLLDPDFAAAADAGTLSGWAPDGRSVGTVAWALPAVRMADHPQRALVGGRQRLHAEVRGDILSSHRAAYRRDDGSWGGWVPQLAEWKTDFLFVPMEDVDLNRALVETPWQPIDLDAPTVPYVDADNEQFSGMIVEVLRQQAFVEVGPWQPTVEIYGGQGWRWDLLDAAGWGIDPAPAIRQSQLFRALDLPLASLRALLPVREHSTPRHLVQEFARCQEHLGYQEWLTFGRSSELRTRLVEILPDRQTDAERSDWMRPTPADGHTSPAPEWAPALALYLEGRLPDAADALADDDPQQLYAAAMIWLEWGDSLRARQALDRVEQMTPDASLSIAVTYWRQQLEEFEGQNLSRGTQRERVIEIAQSAFGDGQAAAEPQQPVTPPIAVRLRGSVALPDVATVERRGRFDHERPGRRETLHE
jgi:hypothetical protein